MQETSIKNYGVSHFSKSKEFKFNRAKLSYESILMTNEYDEPLFSLEEYANRQSYTDVLKFRCKKCGNEFTAKHIDGYHSRCPICYPPQKFCSSEEKEVLEFLKSIYNGCIIENSNEVISPFELDIYIPEKRIAIEFDGLYWHSDVNKVNRNYHLHKTEECEKKGIQLIHIFENEWLFKKDIVKSRLKSIIGVYDKVVFARKCYVKEVDSKTAKAFQESYHIQGSINSKVKLGLFYNSELIALMTFGKSRFSKTYEWELLRFCTKTGYHIPGGANKLLAHFERAYHPKTLVSYADRRWSIGKMYKALNFSLLGESKPDYWYFKLKTYHLESRIKYQKHKLKSILDNYNDSLSEIENMRLNGFYRIFDCGNLVFLKQY